MIITAQAKTKTLQKGGAPMNETELKDQVIKEFVNLQRIKAAQDKTAEIEYQENVLKVRMQALGIPTEDLEIK